MNYKLIAVDMDGTLINTKGIITDSTINAVKKAVNKGVYFVLSTGRPYQAIKKYINLLGLENMPYIIYNGAMVMLGGEIIYNLTINDKFTRKIADEGHLRKSTMVLWANNKLYAEADNEKVRFYKSISGVEPVILKDIGQVSGVTKYVWYDTPELTNKYFKEMNSEIGNEINVYPSRVDFLEFTDKNCSKAIAMKIIGEKLNINADEMIAVGDGFNDLPMIEYAGLGVAMDNAPDEVKNRSNYVTLSCDEDGVKAVIEKYILNNNA